MDTNLSILFDAYICQLDPQYERVTHCKDPYLPCVCRSGEGHDPQQPGWHDEPDDQQLPDREQHSQLHGADEGHVHPGLHLGIWWQST